MIATRLGACAALLLVTGCGGVHGPDYRGEPLATVHGQLTAAEGVDTSRGVRLALAWYPLLAGALPSASPRGIVTEDVVYRGSFPANYQFDFYKPPPPDALGSLEAESGAKRIAIGLLLAYVDQNGNGQLDTIPPGEGPVDAVLGASVNSLFGSTGFWVVYLDDAAPFTDPSGLHLEPGFNLFDKDGRRPLDTPVPIALTGSSDLNLYVCEELTRTVQSAEDLPCQIVWTPPPMVFASLQLDDNMASVIVDVGDGRGGPLDADVTFDGEPLPETQPGSFVRFDSSRTLLEPGRSYVVRVVFAEGAPQELTAVMPGDFSILTPAADASFPRGASVDVAWTPSANADAYEVRIDEAAGSGTFFETDTTSENATSVPIDFTGNARLDVRAQRGGPASAVHAVISHARILHFGP